MPKFSHLVVGLGNPGDDYIRTRHNIGFMAVDQIALRYRCSSWRKKFRGLVTEAPGFLLLKPQTFMNLSGESVAEAAAFYDLSCEQTLVFHDDLDLLPGQVKVKLGGGAGGHNGLKSIDSHLGVDYWRVRLGIGRPMTEQGIPVKGDAVTKYVLSPFSAADAVWRDPLMGALASGLDRLLGGDCAGYLGAIKR